MVVPEFAFKLDLLPRSQLVHLGIDFLLDDERVSLELHAAVLHIAQEGEVEGKKAFLRLKSYLDAFSLEQSALRVKEELFRILLQGSHRNMLHHSLHCLRVGVKMLG